LIEVGRDLNYLMFIKFSSGNEILEDEPRSVGSIIYCIINDKELKALINSDPRQTCHTACKKLNINKETVRLHLYWKNSKVQQVDST